MILWCQSSKTCPLVTCIIADGILTFAIDVVDEVRVPIILFRTASACSFWAYFSLDQLIEAGKFPLKDDDPDRLVTNLPAMERFLWRRDLPSFFFFWANNVDDPYFQSICPERASTNSTNQRSHTQHIWRSRMTYPLPNTQSLTQNLCHQTSSWTLEIQACIWNDCHNLPTVYGKKTKAA